MKKSNNEEILNSIIKRDNAILIGNYDNIIGKTIIYFKCQCGKEYNKCFGFLKKNMFATCKECSKQNGIKKIVNKINKSDNYKEKLNLALKRDNAKLIGDYNRIHPYSRITYMCNCNEEYSKVLRVILSKGGAFCKECSRQNKSKKIKEVLSNSELINDKKKITSNLKYGTDYPIQSKNIQEKIQRNSTKFKKYKMPSGEIRLVQGYEPFALDELIKLYKEEEIKTNRIDFPQIKYISDNKNKYYHPDIYIPHENRIIEIKSKWTYNLRPNIIMDKGKACKEKGYNFEIWIYNYKKEKQIIKL